MSLLDGAYDYIQVSLDTLNSHTHKLWGEVDKIHRVIKGIEVLKEYGLKVKTNTVYTRYNINELWNIYLSVHKLKVDQISFDVALSS